MKDVALTNGRTPQLKPATEACPSGGAAAPSDGTAGGGLWQLLSRSRFDPLDLDIGRTGGDLESAFPETTT